MGGLSRDDQGDSGILLHPYRCGAQGGLGTWHLGLSEPSWAGVAEAHREGVASTAGHLEGLGNANILFVPREITRPCPARCRQVGI